MPLMLTFFVDCVPPKTNHHAKKIVTIKTRGGRVFSRLADTKELIQATGSLIEMFMPHVPPAPIPGPIHLELELTWPWRASDSKRDRALGRIPCTVKPDLDNSCKGITDVLAMLRFIEHDAEISHLCATKWIGNRPGIRITISSYVQPAATAAAPLLEALS